MSTTRWIIETPCEHGVEYQHDESTKFGFVPCSAYQVDVPCADPSHCVGLQRIVVDPDNLPPEAIQRVRQYIRETFPCSCLAAYSERGLVDPHCPTHDYEDEAPNLITAFLSDPEPDDA